MLRLGSPSTATLLALVVCLLAPAQAAADTISLAWDASTDSRVAGYLMYVEVSSGSSLSVDVGPVTTFDFTEAQPGVRYCFSLASYTDPSEGEEPTIGARTGQVCGYSDAPPLLNAIPNQSSVIGQSVSLQLSGSDPEGRAISYSVSGLPSGLSLLDSAGFISGTLSATGTYVVTATVSDGVLSTARTFTWTVAPPDSTPPSVTISSPTSSSSYIASTVVVTLRGSASDSGGISEVTWVNNRGGSGTATGRTSWSFSVTLASGPNVITVTARDAAGNVGSDSLTVTYVGPLVLSSLTANRVAPQPAGTSITFTATIAGGSAPQQFKWWVYDGSSWLVTREWSTSNTWTWTPTSANSAYRVAVWVRNSTSTADAYDNPNSNGSIAFPISAAVSGSSSTSGSTTTSTTSGALALTALSADRPSPQPVGTSITFTASAIGGVAPYQFKWWSYDGSTWRVLREWGSASYTWTPTAANAAYRIAVWARNAGSTADAYDNSNANGSISYPISQSTSTTSTSTSSPTSTSSSSSLTLTGLTANRTAPVPTGTSVTFTATASGAGAPYQYKWWLYDGGGWAPVANWSTANIWTWTPTAANSAYRVAVWVRKATSTEDTYDNVASNGSIAFPVSSSTTTSTTTSSSTSTSTGTLVLQSITASQVSPMRAGTTVRFTANISGGSNPQYKWWVYTSAGWTVMRDWSTSNSWSWTPTIPSSVYRVAVWVRNGSSTVDAYDNPLSNGSIAFPVY